MIKKVYKIHSVFQKRRTKDFSLINTVYKYFWQHIIYRRLVTYLH